MLDSSDLQDDPFSDLLRLVAAHPVLAGGFEAGGDWGLRFPAPDKLKFFALLKGGCWLTVGNDAPLRMEAGDVILLTAPRPFVMAARPETVSIDAVAFFASQPEKIGRLGDGGDCVQLGGHVRLDPEGGALLTVMLPPVIHVRADAPQAGPLAWLLGQLVAEREAAQPGTALITRQIAEMMFVQILRAYLAGPDAPPPGMLRAIADARLAPALRLIHAEPGRDWHLPELARACAMSRTTFATHFRAVAGVSPLAYLTRWRIRLAMRTLREAGGPLAPLAHRLGYASESAFSNAFKREIGVSPTQYRRNRTSRA